jgi:hypothetical protein
MKSFFLAFWKFYRAYLDNKKPNLIWYTQIFVVASLINFIFFAIPDRSKGFVMEDCIIFICIFRTLQMGEISLNMYPIKKTILSTPFFAHSYRSFIERAFLTLFFLNKSLG